MKHTTLRRALALLLSLVLALSLTACGSESQDNSGTAGKLDSTKTDADAAQSGDTDTADDGWQGFSDEAQAALDDLIAHRQQEIFAAAALG